MKPLLLGDCAESAVPARLSLVARLSAWARESLVARAVAVALGLLLLAAIGGSALAGNFKSSAAVASKPGEPPAAASAAPAAPSSRTPDIPDAEAANIVAIPKAEVSPPGARAEAALAPGTTRATPEDPVDLNTANEGDLRRLPGVGEKRAEAILALRAHLPGARFRQVEDLLKVKGVGRAMLKRIHPLVRL